jgi:hypothetical protein
MNVSEINASLKSARAEQTKWTNVVNGLLAVLTAMGANAPAAPSEGKRRGRPKGSAGKKAKATVAATVADVAVTAPADAPVTDGEKRVGRPLEPNSLRGTIMKVLEGHSEGLGVKAIAEAVKASGYTSKSKDFESLIATTLAKPDFKRVAHGTYALQDATITEVAPVEAPVATEPEVATATA